MEQHAAAAAAAVQKALHRISAENMVANVPPVVVLDVRVLDVDHWIFVVAWLIVILFVVALEPVRVIGSLELMTLAHASYNGLAAADAAALCGVIYPALALDLLLRTVLAAAVAAAVDRYDRELELEDFALAIDLGKSVVAAAAFVARVFAAAAAVAFVVDVFADVAAAADVVVFVVGVFAAAVAFVAGVFAAAVVAFAAGVFAAEVAVAVAAFVAGVFAAAAAPFVPDAFAVAVTLRTLYHREEV